MLSDPQNLTQLLHVCLSLMVVVDHCAWT